MPAQDGRLFSVEPAGGHSAMGSMKRLILAKYADINHKQDRQEAMRSYFEGGKLSYGQPQRFRLY